ncbi:serine/threonine protein kinase [Chondrocystis sp. NIES-4102]|nr:serine/threonine protein kinase [Chondrocystis sp. NIES-4102]
MKGKILGTRYKVLEYIATGGFGKTYLAEDTQLPGRDRCVVKQLCPSIEDPEFLAIARRLFKTEASTLHFLGDHAQIPKLLAYFEEEEKFYLVQQYIAGKTLEEELNSGVLWSEIQVIELLIDCLKILEFIHSKGVIHRDIKPDNLIRRHSDRKIVLVDFGTVKEVLKGQTNIELTIAVGTQGYMPIEQARGKPRPTSDIYALGIICIQALTGVAPLDLEEDEEGEIIWESLVNVSPDLAKILTQMTRYHFQARYQSAREIMQDLSALPNFNNQHSSHGTPNSSFPLLENIGNHPHNLYKSAYEQSDYTYTAKNKIAVIKVEPVAANNQPIKSQLINDLPLNKTSDNLKINPAIIWAIALITLLLGGMFLFTQSIFQKLNHPDNSIEQTDPQTPKIN